MPIDTRSLIQVMSDAGSLIGHRVADSSRRFVGSALVWHQQVDPPLSCTSLFPADLTPRVIIPGGMLKPGSSLRVTALYQTGIANTKNARIMVGMSQIDENFTIAANLRSAFQQRDAWIVDVDGLTRIIGMPNPAQHAQTDADDIFDRPFDWRQDQPVYLEGQCNVFSGDSIRVRAWRLELFPAE